MKLNILIILSGLFAFSCSSVKMDSPETATKLVEFSKSPCFGTCPSYNLIINTDGSMEYIGKRHVQRKGIFTKQLDEETYKKIYVALKKENIYQYDDIYNEDIKDGSKTRIIYYGSEGKKAFGTLYTYPGNTEEIAKMLESIATVEEGWEAEEKITDEVETTKSDKPTRKILSYSQGACFGQCPVYSVDIFSDGRMMYLGKSYTKMKGIYQKEISEKDLAEIISLVESEEFKTVNTRDDENIMDAQQFKVIYYSEESKSNEVKWKINNAKVLEDIKAFYANQIKSKGWKQQTADNSLDSETIKNTVIVSLSPKVQAKDWILTKRHLDAKIIKFLSPNGTYFLMSYNPELIQARVMEELRRDRNVLNVQSGSQKARPRKGTTTGQSGKKGSATIRDKGN